MGGGGIWVLVAAVSVAVAVVSLGAALFFRQMAKGACQREERFVRLFENSHTPMLIFDTAGGVIVDANHAAVAFYGHPLERLRGMSVAEIDTMAPEEVSGRMAQQRQDPVETVRVLKHRLADGEERDVQVHVGALPEADHPLCYAIVVDVTERERAREELEVRRERLEALVDERTQELVQTQRELSSVAAVVGRTVEARDPYTAGHQQRVAVLAQMIARQLQFDEESSARLTIAASLHDLGKISIPLDILAKPSRLSEPEYAIITEHPAIGHEILADVPFDWPLADVVLQHHERIDGSGYPQGLDRRDVHLWARILAVADVVEAMSSHRPYRPALGVDAALEEIEDGREKLYCPECVDACLEVFRAEFSFD
jgi:PAS domain S-box-containing protein